GLCPTSLPRNGSSSYSEDPWVEILQHGEAHPRIVAVPGRLRRPPGNAARPHALSSLRRARARPSRQCVWSPHVRDHALLERRPARVGRGGTRLRGGVAKPTEVGRVALVEVSRPQRHAGPEMTSGPCCASLRLGSSGRLTSPDQTWREA